MSNGLVPKYQRALAALAALLICGVSAQASTLDLGGSTLSPARMGFYGSAPSQNNVINSPGSPATGSVLTDPTGPNVGANSPWLSGAAPTTTLATYSVNWFYAGSESGYNITFNAPGLSGGAGPYTESDSNSNCVGCAPHSVTTPVFMGTTQNSLSFVLSWITGSVGSQNPGNNLIYAYLQPDSTNTNFTLTTNPTDWFVFGLNDSGSPDSDYDDFVGFAQIVQSPGPGPGQTPLPAALPLMATAMLGGGMLLKRRKRAAKAL